LHTGVLGGDEQHWSISEIPITAEQRRQEAEKRRADEAWARAEWFEKREKKMKKLARRWDEAATADER